MMHEGLVKVPKSRCALEETPKQSQPHCLQLGEHGAQDDTSMDTELLDAEVRVREWQSCAPLSIHAACRGLHESYNCV